MKLYVILQSTFSRGMACAQAIHAAFAFSRQHPDVVDSWKSDNNVVVLVHDPAEPLEALQERLTGLGLKTSAFREPDLGHQMTALCAEPNARPHLRELRLA
ncbi:hypothetical protein EBT31_03920 [bacterium]|nr:hypothetical protein [bacterium]